MPLTKSRALDNWKSFTASSLFEFFSFSFFDSSFGLSSAPLRSDSLFPFLSIFSIFASVTVISGVIPFFCIDFPEGVKSMFINGRYYSRKKFLEARSKELRAKKQLRDNKGRFTKTL